IPKILIKDVENLPVPSFEEMKSSKLNLSSITIINSLKEIDALKTRFVNLLKNRHEISITKSLQNWPSLDFKGFLKELKKAKVNLSLADEAEWMDYFNAQKAKVQTLQQEVDALDKQIDKMVYELYGLTE